MITCLSTRSMCFLYFILVNIWVSSASPVVGPSDREACVTSGGPKPGLPCIFPFLSGGQTYTSCTTNRNLLGVAWCPTPIPEDFLNQWVTGRKVSFRAPEATSKAKVKSKAADPVTQPECQLTMDQSIVSAAGGIS